MVAIDATVTSGLLSGKQEVCPEAFSFVPIEIRAQAETGVTGYTLVLIKVHAGRGKEPVNRRFLHPLRCRKRLQRAHAQAQPMYMPPLTSSV
jgi:hypothetical protein